MNVRDRDRYLELVLQFPLRSIRSEAQLSAAQKVMDRILADGPLDSGATTYLDALSDLVAVYEETHHPIPTASDADMLRHLLDSRGVPPARLGEEAGIAKSSLSEVLSGKRKFSRQMIRKLADYFQIDIGILASNL